MKKTIAFILSVMLLASACVTGGAYADKNWLTDSSSKKIKYVYNEEFSTTPLGEKPAGLKITELQNTKVSVAQGDKDENGKYARYLHIYDNNASGDAKIDIPLSTKKQKLLLETKFKITHPENDKYLGFYIDFYGTDAPLARICRTGTVNYLYYFSYAGVNLYPIQSAMMNNVWYECEMLIDLSAGTWDLQIVSDAFKDKVLKNSGRLDPEKGIFFVEGLPLSPDKYQKGVTSLRFHTYGATGSMYVDYIRVRDDVNALKYKGKPPEKLKLPTIAPFIISSPYENINVNYKGEYLFFALKPFVENGKVYAPLRTISSAYGFNLSYADGIYTLKKDGTEVTVSESGITVNGKALEGENVKLKSGIYCISVVDFATAMGDKATYDKDVVIE